MEWLDVTRDPATGLLNAAIYKDRLERALESARHRGQAVCVMSVAVPTGDLRDLTDAGLAIAEAIRASDTVARFGTCELGVILPGLAERLHAETVVGRIDRVVCGGELQVGSAIYPHDGRDAESLITIATRRRDSVAA